MQKLKPDWSGGDTSAGFWTGRPFQSPFIARQTERPQQGLVSLYLDTGVKGKWARKNTAQRMGLVNNLLWTFVPSSVAVSYGSIWAIFDGEVKRFERFRQLEKGCKGASSLCLDYHCFWAPLSVFQAARHRQWAVVCSSIGSTLALISIPLVQNYTFAWVIFSGGHFDWGAGYSWQVGLMKPYWASILLGLSAACLVCCFCLFFFTTSTQMVAMTQINGIMGLLELVRGKTAGDFNLDKYHEEASFNDVADRLWENSFRICTINNTTTLEIVPKPSSSNSSPIRHSSRLRRIRERTHKHWKSFASFCHTAEMWMNGSPYPFLLRPFPLGIWIMYLLLLFAANCFVIHKMTTPRQLSDQNYALPRDPNLYIAPGVFIQVLSIQYSTLCIAHQLISSSPSFKCSNATSEASPY